MRAENHTATRLLQSLRLRAHPTDTMQLGRLLANLTPGGVELSITAYPGQRVRNPGLI